jgi:hypothetical protein
MEQTDPQPSNYDKMIEQARALAEAGDVPGFCRLIEKTGEWWFKTPGIIT